MSVSKDARLLSRSKLEMLMTRKSKQNGLKETNQRLIAKTKIEM